MLKESELNFLKRLLFLRHITVESACSNISGDIKTAIEELGYLLRIDSGLLEQLYILIYFTKPDKYFIALKKLDVLQFQQGKNQTQWQNYLDYFLSKYDSIDYRYNFIRNRVKDIFLTEYSATLYQHVLIHNN